MDSGLRQEASRIDGSLCRGNAEPHCHSVGAAPSRNGGRTSIPSNAASRSASAMSSMVLALKNGSSGVVGHVAVAKPIACGPAVDFPDILDDQRVAKLLAQRHAPQSDHRMRLPVGGGDRKLRVLFGARAMRGARPDRAAGTDSPPPRSGPRRPRDGSPPPSRGRRGCPRAVPENPPRCRR